MKTLDEVINALEKCTAYDAECEGCPYQEDNEGGLECEMRNLEEVLHYLKEYRVVTDICHKHGIASVWGQVLPDVEKTDWDKRLNFDNAYDNPPLTWSELRQMEGKPVWVEEYLPVMEDEVGVTEDEGEYNKHWDIVKKVYRKQITFYVQGMSNSKDWQGIAWQAYRKERS